MKTIIDLGHEDKSRVIKMAFASHDAICENNPSFVNKKHKNFVDDEVYDELFRTIIDVEKHLQFLLFFYEGVGKMGESVVREARVISESTILRSSYVRVGIVERRDIIPDIRELHSIVYYRKEKGLQNMALVVGHKGDNSIIERYSIIYERFATNRIRENIENPNKFVMEFLSKNQLSLKENNINQKIFMELNRVQGLQKLSPEELDDIELREKAASKIFLRKNDDLEFI